MNAEKSYSFGSRMAGACLEQSWLFDGLLWRISTGFLDDLTTSGYYKTLNFTTPETGRTFYGFITLDKTGAEIFSSLIEGGTYTVGSATDLTMYNLKQTSTSTAPFTPKLGLFTTSGTSITGGTTIASRLTPGASTGLSKPGGSVEAGGWLELKPGTMYTVKMECKGAVTAYGVQLVFAYTN